MGGTMLQDFRGGSGPTSSFPKGSFASGKGGRNGNRNRNRNRQSQRSHQDANAFTGRIPELKGCVYDIEAYNYGKILFSTTTEQIAMYIVRKNAGSGDILTALNPEDLGFPELTKPTEPDPNDAVQMAIWEIEYEEYREMTWSRSYMSRHAYVVVLGQCSDRLLIHLRVHARWNEIDKSGDVIGLLEIIRETLFSGGAVGQKNPLQAFIEAEKEFYLLVQGRDNISTYRKKFREMVQRYKWLGGEPGINPSSIRTALVEAGVDPDNATADQLVDARSKAEDEYLAIRFLPGLNHKEQRLNHCM
eukprot:scaffold22653_cov119-Cylindrotheca_fusiformis.AAC.21